MGGMLGGLLIALLLVGVGRRLTAVAGYSLLGSAGMTAIMHGLFHLLPGSWWHTAGIFALALAATSTAIVGLHAALGKAGIPIGAIATMFVGNPLSSASAPTEFMPWHWGGIGQWFVPGAASTLLRLTSYFPKASMLAPLLVLAAWVAAGVLLSVFGHYRSQEVIHLEGYTEPDEPRHAHRDADGAVEVIEPTNSPTPTRAAPQASVGATAAGSVA